jgi:uncharacterized protein (TIGR03083 family)
MNTLELARQEREELVSTLACLTPEQWEAPTLCEGWCVRDVVAHVISYDAASLRELVGWIIQGRCRIDRINALSLDRHRKASVQELVSALAEHLTPTGVLALMGGAIGLTDGLIHHQDIRRPLGLQRTIPEKRLVIALRTALFEPTMLGVQRVVGLRLVATDIDWSFGRGAEVRGPAEALLMAVAGRPVTADLVGPGQVKLARRVRRIPRGIREKAPTPPSDSR